MSIRTLYCGSFCRWLCMVLALAMATEPSAIAVAQQPVPQSPVAQSEGLRQSPRAPGDTTLVAAPNAGKMDVKYVTPQSVAYIVARPHQLLTSPSTAMFPIEVASAAGLQYLGVDPVDVEQIVIFAEPPTPLAISYGVVVKFTKPFDISKVPPQAFEHTQLEKIGEEDYLQSTHPQMPSVYMPDDLTLVLMPDATLRRVLGTIEPVKSPLVDRLRELPSGGDFYAAIDVESLRPLINPWLNVAVMKAGDEFPAEAKPFLDVPNLVEAVDFTFNLSNAGPTALVLHANDEVSADRLETLYALSMELQARRWAQEYEKLAQSEDPVQRALGQYMERISKISSQAYQPVRHGDSLVLFRGFEQNDPVQRQLMTVAVIGIVVALTLPAIQAAREAARRNQSLSQLKQIILAMHNYADANRSMPPHAIYSAEGKPLLSWRVMILPYLGEMELYKQFKLDEPWDSEHNRALIAQMPAVYDNPNVNEPDKTNYLAFVGEQCVLNGTKDGISFAQISDGTSKTILLVEADANQAVEWTRPVDIAFDPNRPTAGFGSLRPGGCNVAWGDGRASFLNRDTPPDVVKAFITRNGREAVDVHQ